MFNQNKNIKGCFDGWLVNPKPRDFRLRGFKILLKFK